MTEENTLHTPSEKQPQQSKKILLGILFGAAFVILLGIGLGLYYHQLPENNPQRNQSSCEKAGGEWAIDQSVCLISNRVAGEACTDGGQCESGICFPPDLTEAQRTVLNDGPVIGIAGTCYAEEFITGCVKQVINGTVTQESLCYE